MQLLRWFSLRFAALFAASLAVAFASSASATTLSINSTTLAAATVGSAYSVSLSAAGGVSPYTWSLVSPSKAPASLALHSSGLLNGTPTTAATAFTFKVQVKDSTASAPLTATATISITIKRDPLVVTTTELTPEGVEGTAYSAKLACTGATGTVSWALASGSSLVHGLALNAKGVVSGTPTASTNGLGSFKAVVSDSASPKHTATAAVQYVINPENGTFKVTTVTLAEGVLSTPYSAKLASAGGTGTVTWSLAKSTTLPKGLTLASNGTISGTPSGAVGVSDFWVQAEDSSATPKTVTAFESIGVETRTATPQFHPASGTVAYSSGVTITEATAGATVYYTTSGATPTTSSTKYTNSISVTQSETIKAIAYATGHAPSLVASASYTVQPPLSLPPSGPLATGTVNSPYSAQIAASGGVGPTFTWVVNGLGISSPGLSVTLADGLSATTADNNVLKITGTPTSPTQNGSPISFTASVTDSANHTVGPVTYTIAVNAEAQTYQVFGNIWENSCGSGSLPPITVKISTNPVQTTTTNSSGSFSFANVPNGTYTVTPSIAGPSSVFYPVSQSVTVRNSQSNTSFSVALGYKISGTVAYSGSKTGRVYISLSNSNCGGTSYGTSISAPGAFTIRGVPPGSYTLSAWMDNLGFGQANASNPSGSSTGLNLSSANLTNAKVTLEDAQPVTLSSAPSIQGFNGFEGGAFIGYNPLANDNGVELAQSYTVQWSTGSTFATVSGSHSYPATGENGSEVFFVTGLDESAKYYFRFQGVAGSSTSSWSSPVGPITIGPPSTGYTISGSVTFSGTATGPLYVGFYDQNLGIPYSAVIQHPVSPQSYSVMVPAGSDYFLFGIIDQNNNGIVDSGDIQNVNGNGGTAVTISASKTGVDLTLPSGNSTTSLVTQIGRSFNQQNYNGWNNLQFETDGSIKTPANVSILSGPHIPVPVDFVSCSDCGHGIQFGVSTGSDVPAVGDTYGLQIDYTDGTSDTLSARVSGVLSAFVSSMSPSSTGAGATPGFSWTDPANAGNYIYTFSLQDSNYNTIWQIPAQHSHSNGFSSSITSLTWGVDPTNSGNTPSVSSLTVGAQYYWSITAQDSNGNSSAMQAVFQP